MVRLSSGSWLRAALGAAALLLAPLGRPALAGPTLQTTTTTYTYNADGAPTAVTTQVDDQAATTVYLTWDNFTPDAGAPSDGTVSAANGNLLGLGADPGGAAQYGYDVRDRMIDCSPVGQSESVYTYYPISQLATSTLASGDSLQFYYDNSRLPLMTNTSQPSSGTVSSFLGPIRYLSDGTEQVLLLPRKDVAAVYDAGAQSLSPYGYEPYGGPLTPADDSVITDYDLSENPFQYAGEYLDPTCDAYYLRARWYLPEQQTFLSRDPADALHRYSYAGGNPIGRRDPSGLRYTGEDFSRDVGKAVHRLEPHMWAYIAPVIPVWGDVLGGIQLVGLLPSFFHHPTASGITEFSFLAASIVSEVGGETRSFDRLFASHASAFQARIGIDLALGASQTAAQADQHGRLDVPALIQGIDTTAYGILWGRVAGGLGYRPYGMTVDDLDSMAGDHFRDPAHADTALVFRVRSGRHTFTSPIMEHFHLGNYHEAVFAVSRDVVLSGEVGLGNDGGYTWLTRWSRDPATLTHPSNYFSNPYRQLQAVGTYRADAVDTAIRSEMSFAEQNAMRSQTGHTASPFPEYKKYSNNCQHNAARVRSNIVMFHRAPVIDDLDAAN